MQKFKGEILLVLNIFCSQRKSFFGSLLVRSYKCIEQDLAPSPVELHQWQRVRTGWLDHDPSAYVLHTEVDQFD